MQGIPASVQVFACAENSVSQPVARRSFFRCSTVQLSWNRGSTGLLVLVQADVDKTNQSYYGETKLNYLTTNGTHEGLVPLSMLHSLNCANQSQFYWFQDAHYLIYFQVKKDQFMMFSGHMRGQNLLLFMGVSLFL